MKAKFYLVLLPAGAPALDEAFVTYHEAEFWASLGYVPISVSVPMQPMRRPPITSINYQEPKK